LEHIKDITEQFGLWMLIVKYHLIIIYMIYYLIIYSLFIISFYVINYFYFIYFILFYFIIFFINPQQKGNSNQLLTASADNEVKLWSVEKGNNIDSWPHTNPVRSVMFAMGDKQFLTVTDQVMQQFPTVRIFDIRSSN